MADRIQIYETHTGLVIVPVAAHVVLIGDAATKELYNSNRPDDPTALQVYNDVVEVYKQRRLEEVGYAFEEGEIASGNPV